MLPFAVLFCFAVCSMSVSAVETDTTNHCLKPRSKVKTPVPCGTFGTILYQSPNTTFEAYSVQECATHCYDPSLYPSCASFAFTAGSTSDTPGTCVTYEGKLRGMKFKKSKSSQTAYYSRTCYFARNLTDDPLYDGNFGDSSDSPANPWIKGGTNPSSVFDYHQATEYSYGSGSAELSQSLATCPGNTYQIEFEEGDFGFAGTWIVTLNGVTVFTKTADDGHENDIGPIYFTATSAKTLLEFKLFKATKGDTNQVIYDVSMGTVYRGSIPEGTTVYTV